MSLASPTAMQIAREELNEATVKLDIVCSSDQVRSGFQKAIKSLGKKLRLPGFRPGQAPAAMVEKALNPQDLYGAAADNIVIAAINDAFKQQSIEPAGQPVVDLTKLEKDTSECEFSVKVPLKPIVELGDYKGLPVARPEIAVTDEEVERNLDELRRRGGKQEKITDRGIEEGDMAVVNIRVDGHEGEGRTFMTIAGQTFPQLDQLIMGMHAEEIKQAELDFPPTFQEKDWAGSKQKCHVTIRSISAVQMPELSDEFAASLNAEGLSDLRDKVRIGIQRAKESMTADMVNEQLMDALAARSRIVVATTTWESVAQRRLSEMAQELQRRKSNMEAYAKEQNMSVEELVAALEQEAKVHVERAVMIEHVFTAEKMKISETEANRHFLEIAQANGVEMDNLAQFAKEFGAQIREEVLYRAMHSQVMTFLTEHANVSVQAPDAAAKPKAAKPKAEAGEEPKKKSAKKKAE